MISIIIKDQTNRTGGYKNISSSLDSCWDSKTTQINIDLISIQPVDIR